METHLTERQRSEEGSKDFSGPILILFLVALVIAAFGLGGCSTTLDRSMATCFGLDKNPAYTKAEGLEKFSCEGSGTVSTRVAR